MNPDKLRWSAIFMAFVASLVLLLCSGCVLTETREATGTSPLGDAVSTAVGRAATGNWIGALVGGVGTLVGGAGAVYAQRKRRQGKKQLAEVVRGVSEFVSRADENTVAMLYEALSQAMDRDTKNQVRKAKRDLNE